MDSTKRLPVDDDRIMTSFDLDRDRSTVTFYGMLRCSDRRGRLDGCAENNRASIADAAKDAASMIRLFENVAFCIAAESIVVCKTCSSGNFKTIANLKTFDCTDGEDCFGEVCVQFFKYRIAKSCGNSRNDAFYDAAGRIFSFRTILPDIVVPVWRQQHPACIKRCSGFLPS